MKTPPVLPTAAQQQHLKGVRIRLVQPCERLRCDNRLAQHHYLGALKPVGERLYYVVTDARGRWLGVLIFCAAARLSQHQRRALGIRRHRRSGLYPAPSAICCHLMNQSYYNHAKFTWDQIKFEFTGGTGDPKWLTRDYRSPWSV